MAAAPFHDPSYSLTRVDKAFGFVSAVGFEDLPEEPVEYVPSLDNGYFRPSFEPGDKSDENVGNSFYDVRMGPLDSAGR